MDQGPEGLHMITDISKKQDMPKSFVAKILQKLAKAKIVSLTRGVNGGFALRKKPSEITLLHLIEAVQGPIFINACVVDNKSCSRRSRCSVHPVWIEIRDILIKKLNRYNFQKFLDNMMPVPAKSVRVPVSDVNYGCSACAAVRKGNPVLKNRSGLRILRERKA